MERGVTRDGYGSSRIALALLLLLICVRSGASGERRAIELRLPPDRVLADAADSPAAVVFSHESHVAYTEQRCLPCHPQPFSILGRHVALRHVEMDAGRACGSCHDGNEATAATDDCTHCHTGSSAEGRP